MGFPESEEPTQQLDSDKMMMTMQGRESESEEQECWWKHLPIGAEHIVRSMAAEVILHELLDKVVIDSDDNDDGDDDKKEKKSDEKKEDCASNSCIQFDVIRRLVQEFPGTCYKSYRFRWEDGSTRDLLPLAMICCLHPSLETVKAVYEANPGAISVSEPYKQALPFHLASAFEASLDVLEFVYSKHPDAIATPRNDGVYPLHLACGFYLGNSSVINFLLNEYPQGAQKVCTVIEWSPLHSACHGGVPDVSLLERLHNLDPTMMHQTDKHGRTPLHLACRSRKGNPQAVEYLVRTAPGSLNVRDNLDGWTPLFLASVRQPPAVIEAMLSVAADWDTIRTADARTGDTLLHYAAILNSAPAVEFLAQRFPHMLYMRTTDNAQATPLARAIEHAAPLDNIRVLIHQGPRALFIANGAGRRPLLLATNNIQKYHHLSSRRQPFYQRGFFSSTSSSSKEKNDHDASQYQKELVELLKQSEKTYRACRMSSLVGFYSSS
ncbi:hypothetical protein ACA910_008998 [Epithemia clementina (nom. ined.)]